MKSKSYGTASQPLAPLEILEKRGSIKSNLQQANVLGKMSSDALKKPGCSLAFLPIAYVIPAKAGIQETCGPLDSDFRRNDVLQAFSDSFLASVHPETLVCHFERSVAEREIFEITDTNGSKISHLPSARNDSFRSDTS